MQNNVMICRIMASKRKIHVNKIVVMSMCFLEIDVGRIYMIRGGGAYIVDRQSCSKDFEGTQVKALEKFKQQLKER